MRMFPNYFIVSVNVDRLASTARTAGDEVEVLVEGTLGTYLMFGDIVAVLAGVAADDDSWDDDVRAAFGLDDIRDVDAESGYRPTNWKTSPGRPPPVPSRARRPPSPPYVHCTIC